MKIKEKFLELTSRTYPHGTEEDVIPLLGSNLEKDEFGNLFIKIGESDVMFTSHLDTATSALSEVKHVIQDNIIKTDGKSILGADDKAGVTIMLYMIENKIPGLYYFFLGEEVGCIGSRKVANKYKTEKVSGINKVISFDRRGYDSIITFQSGQRCCSEKFGEELSKQFNQVENTFSYKNDPTGLLTDSIQFISIYPECTNISVGYKSEHTFGEQQDIEHLEKLAEACLKIDWNGLPVDRDPSVAEYKSYGRGYGYGFDDYDYYDYGYSSYGFTKNYDSKPKTEKFWFHDTEFNYVSNVEINSFTKKTVSVDLCQDRINAEKLTIKDLLNCLELGFDDFSWDGFKLKVIYQDGKTSECDRNDIIEYLPEFDYSTIEELNSRSTKKMKRYLDEKNNYTVEDFDELDAWSSDLYD